MKSNACRKSKIDFNKTLYRRALRRLMYLMIGTRPDLAFAVGSEQRSFPGSARKDIWLWKQELFWTLQHL